MNSIKKIWISPYTLVERFTQKEHQGVLLKILFHKGEVGYSSLQPFKAFNEGFLVDYIQFLKKDFSQIHNKSNLSHEVCKKTALLQVIFQDGWMDAKARAQGQSLLNGYPIIKNHYLIHYLDSVKDLDMTTFSVFKIKMGQRASLKKDTLLLKQMVKNSPSSVLFRLDFNNSLSRKEWLKWEEENKGISHRIDFIEDPFLNFYCIPSSFVLAQDWSQTHYCEVRVIKSSRFHLKSVYSQVAHSRSSRIIFTHSLSHPLEARLSWVKASQFYKVYPSKKEICGLHYDKSFYEKNDFSEFHNSFYSPTGAGLGFGELLEKQSWKLL